jgi:probable HAF family extracellular repeat protein
MYAQRLLAAWFSKVAGSGRKNLTLHDVEHELEKRSAVLSLRLLVVAAVVFLLPVSRIQGAALYSILDLGDLPGGEDYSGGNAINSLGEVTGHSSATTNRAFVWDSADGMRQLGDLPGTRHSIGAGISDAGAIAGWRFDIASNRQRAFLWTDAGGMRDLNNLPGFDTSRAFGLNSSGEVVGESGSTADHAISRAVLWTADGSPIDIGDLPGGAEFSVAEAINDNGQVAGYSLSSLGWEAFIWTSATGMQALGGLQRAPQYSRPFAINSAGHVVGESNAARGRVAFLWSPAGGMVDLGDYPGGQDSSSASDINSNGLVVGSAYASFGTAHAFLWTPDSGMQDLTSLLDASGAGWNLELAIEINDSGQITGSGVNPAGMRRAFLLTPVPEPATIALLVCGCIALTAMARLARRKYWNSG